MHRIAILSLLVATLANVGAAAAQGRVRANERYCLETSSGGRSGGTGPLMCRFVTMEQCFQSKTSPGDRCMLNPWLAMPRRY